MSVKDDNRSIKEKHVSENKIITSCIISIQSKISLTSEKQEGNQRKSVVTKDLKKSSQR